MADLSREIGAEETGTRWVKWIVIAASAAGLAYLAYTIWDQEAVMRWMREARPVPFFIALALLPAFGAPVTPFFVLAGATFGVAVGLIGTGLALAANFTLCYWIARSSLRPRFEALLRRFDYELPNFSKQDQKPLRFTLLMKLTPGIPGFVKSYGLGTAGVPFVQYFIASMLITGVYAALLIVLGESLLEHDIDRSLLVGGAIALAVAAGAWWWIRRRKRQAVTG